MVIKEDNLDVKGWHGCNVTFIHGLTTKTSEIKWDLSYLRMCICEY